MQSNTPANHQREPGSRTMKTIRNSGILVVLAARRRLRGRPAAAGPRDRARHLRSRESRRGGDARPGRPSLGATSRSQLAEQSFAQDGDTQGTRDLAYVADRRAQIAEARGAAMAGGQQQQQTLGQHARRRDLAARSRPPRSSGAPTCRSRCRARRCRTRPGSSPPSSSAAWTPRSAPRRPPPTSPRSRP